MFRDAYALRRCIVPVDGFFEWRAIPWRREAAASQWRPLLLFFFCSAVATLRSGAPADRAICAWLYFSLI
jgi:putative SOS response-associated peptidase YedK